MTVCLSVRVDLGRQPSPSEAIDSESVKSAAMVSQAVGFDRNKGGKRFWRSIHLLVLRVLVTAANVGEREGERVLKPVKQMGSSVSRLHTMGRCRF